MCESPNSEFFQPPNEYAPIGTGMGTLTPTMPTSMSTSNRRAVPPSRVKIAVPFAYGLALMSCDGLVVGLDAHDRQHRAEDLVVVHLHAGLDVVDERDADEEPVGVELRRGAVDHDGGALGGGAGHVGGDLVAVLAGDERAHLRRGVGAGADAQRGDAAATISTRASATWSPTATSTETAMQRSPAEP